MQPPHGLTWQEAESSSQQTGSCFLRMNSVSPNQGAKWAPLPENLNLFWEIRGKNTTSFILLRKRNRFFSLQKPQKEDLSKLITAHQIFEQQGSSEQFTYMRPRVWLLSVLISNGFKLKISPTLTVKCICNPCCLDGRWSTNTSWLYIHD